MKDKKTSVNTKKTEQKTTGKKIGEFLESKAKIFGIILLVVIIGLLSYVIVTKVTENKVSKLLGELDAIKFELTDYTATPTDEEWAARFDKAKAAIAPYTQKSGIVGVRANIMLGDICATLENYTEAVTYYQAAADKKKNSYTYSFAYNQLAVCYEQLKDFEKAADAYKVASEDKDNRLKTHALFNYGRVLEQQGNIEAALEVYQKLVDEDPDNSYAMIAKTRILANEIKSK